MQTPPSVEIVEASFVKSAPNLAAAPENDLINEVAFLARSNTGKSSLLNALTNRKGLAKVSATPGKTRLINYFDVTFMDREAQEKLSALFVDLPGFGYAKVSKSIHADWEKNLTDYVANRKQIRVFIHLIDARHPELEIDRSVEEFLQQVALEHQHIVRVYTKMDKLNQKELGALRRFDPGALMISNTKKRGIDRLCKQIYTLLRED